MTNSPTIAAQLDAADQYRNCLTDIVPPLSTDRMRTRLVFAHVDLGLEHHAAIASLIRLGLNGSASALVRPLYEAVLRGHWVAECAPDDDIDTIATDDRYRFPRTDTLAAALDQNFTRGELFAGIGNRSWGHMNSYTHPGLHQLGRRFDGSGFTEEELREVVAVSTAFVFMLGVMFTGHIGTSNAQEKVYALLERFSNDPRISWDV